MAEEETKHETITILLMTFSSNDRMPIQLPYGERKSRGIYWLIEKMSGSWEIAASGKAGPGAHTEGSAPDLSLSVVQSSPC